MRNKTRKHSTSTTPIPTTTLTESILKEAIDSAETIIPQWWFCDESDHCVTASLFSAHEVAADFISTVNNLHSAITIFLASNNASSSKLLLRSHQLIHIAMKRLGREFHCILKKHSPTPRLNCMVSVDSDNVNSLVSKLPPQATGDLKSIAACMVNCGFSKECAHIYKTIRKAAVDEALYRLGMDPLSLNLLQSCQRLDWEAIESKIRNWLSAIKIALKAVFSQERILCDLVFSASSPIRESCFAEVAGEGALSVVAFPEQVTDSSGLQVQKVPERLFRILDLYEAISELAPELAATFSSSAVRLQAETSLEKLREAARTALAEFESSIQKDSSSKNPVAGGGVHPLTRYVMNYLAFLSDYSGVLEGILATWQLNLHAPLPEEYAAKESKAAVRFMWLLLVLLSKLDRKSEVYKDVSLSYLFLANNLRYVVRKVRTSGLRRIVGERWIAAHEEKVRQYAASYERTGWTKVYKALISEAEESLERGKARFREFNAAFLEVQRRHMEWVVVDPELREDIKDSLARNVVSKYRHMYTRYRGKLASRNVSVESVVRYAPEDVENYLWGLLFGCSDGDSTSRGRASSTTSLLSSASSSPSMSPLLRARCHK